MPTIGRTAQTLATKHILSAPVLTEDNDICGFLDIRDILSSFLDGEFWNLLLLRFELYG